MPNADLAHIAALPCEVHNYDDYESRKLAHLHRIESGPALDSQPRISVASSFEQFRKQMSDINAKLRGQSPSTQSNGVSRNVGKSSDFVDDDGNCVLGCDGTCERLVGSVEDEVYPLHDAHFMSGAMTRYRFLGKGGLSNTQAEWALVKQLPEAAHKSDEPLRSLPGLTKRISIMALECRSFLKSGVWRREPIGGFT
jgi:hypothetical protein